MTTRRWRRALCVAAMAVATAGCSQITTFDEFHAPDAGADAGPVSDASPDASATLDAASPADAGGD